MPLRGLLPLLGIAFFLAGCGDSSRPVRPVSAPAISQAALPDMVQDNREQKAAVEAIYKLFGKVDEDWTRKGQPVIKVDFSSTLTKKVFDHDLAILKPLTEIE